ncbi:hypothetical protein OG417_46380 [Actinoallomurus sp. NBC_01490]|uniref:hypothetical protein n=1 Tax=Actinoallomurus sp. NBC_01490 TaxID=2903557 RepID=UPI002E367E6C|nr:hypothetical protein [Actinoallomurus sp. NBC_01490]
MSVPRLAAARRPGGLTRVPLAAVSLVTACSTVSSPPDYAAFARQIGAAAAATRSAVAVRATVHVALTYLMSRYELSGTVNRTTAGFTFTGTSTVRAGAGLSARKVRVISVAGRSYAASALLPHRKADQWTLLSSPDQLVPITGSSTVDLAVLDPRFYLAVMDPAYWTSHAGIGMPEPKETTATGGVRTRHYLTGCGYGSSYPGCDWARLGSLFRVWHGSPSDAAEDVWIDPGRHVVRRIAVDWGLWSPANVPLYVKGDLDLTTLPAPVPITAPPNAR